MHPDWGTRSSFQRRQAAGVVVMTVGDQNLFDIARLTPDFAVVQGSALPVLGRSLSSLIKTHARLTLVATREFAKNRNMDFNLAYIDDDFPTEPKPSFETSYMRSVYSYGFDKAASGRIWQKQIPFLTNSAAAVVRR